MPKASSMAGMRTTQNLAKFSMIEDVVTIPEEGVWPDAYTALNAVANAHGLDELHRVIQLIKEKGIGPKQIGEIYSQEAGESVEGFIRRVEQR